VEEQIRFLEERPGRQEEDEHEGLESGDEGNLDGAEFDESDDKSDASPLEEEEGEVGGVEARVELEATCKRAEALLKERNLEPASLEAGDVEGSQHEAQNQRGYSERDDEAGEADCASVVDAGQATHRQGQVEGLEEPYESAEPEALDRLLQSRFAAEEPEAAQECQHESHQQQKQPDHYRVVDVVLGAQKRIPTSLPSQQPPF